MTAPPMSTRSRTFIRNLALASLALVAGCGRQVATQAPLDPAALAVVKPAAGVPR